MPKPPALLYSQYLHALGGGERVMVAVAELLADTHDVRLGAPRLPDEARWRSLGFPDGLDIVRMNAREFTRASVRAKLGVVMTNNVPLPSLARRSLLIVQFPNDRLASYPAARRVAGAWTLDHATLVTYSEFNARHLRNRWGGRSARVLPPPVRQIPADLGDKERLILSVGRLTEGGNHKRHDALIEAFGRLRPLAPGWRFVVAGGGRSDDPYALRLTELAAVVGSVEVCPDLPADRLDDLYRRASIYWHAAGYGRSADDPSAAEHFGMTTVEAMSAGAVPVVFDDGGQTEIVADGSGRTWRDLDELVAVTADLVADEAERADLAGLARGRAAEYRPDVYAQRLRALLSEIGA